MRSLLIKSLFFFSFLAFLAGYQWIGNGAVLSSVNTALADAQPDPTPAKTPKAVFPETTYDFDSVAEGTEIKHDFIVENHGQAPLTIERVQPD